MTLQDRSGRQLEIQKNWILTRGICRDNTTPSLAVQLQVGLRTGKMSVTVLDASSLHIFSRSVLWMPGSTPENFANRCSPFIELKSLSWEPMRNWDAELMHCFTSHIRVR